MLCLTNYHKTGFGIFLSVFFAVLSVFFFSNTNVSAVSDYSVIIDDSNYTSLDVPCSPDCSSYHYVLFSDFSGTGTFIYQISPYSSNSSARLVLTFNQFLHNNLSFSLFSLDNADRFIYAGSNWALGTGISFKLTFSENNPFGSAPSGSITLTENGTFDVSSYASAVVDVPPVVEPGDYHEDLISIQQAIYVCGAILLVLYFFYCIYRMFIKTTGGYL